MTQGSTSEWYYLESGQTRGPVPALELARAFQAGQVNLDTSIWRDGMPEWQPLRLHLQALGLDPGATSQPPPIPGVTPPPPPMARPRAVAAAPETRIAGCRPVTLIVIGALLLGGLFVCAILAAIALPAYQDYVLRAKTAEVIAQAQPLKLAVREYLADHDDCPSRDDLQPLPELSGRFIGGTEFGRFDDGLCGIEITVGGAGNDRIDGKAIWFDYDAEAQAWGCTSEIDDRYLPQDCRG